MTRIIVSGGRKWLDYKAVDDAIKGEYYNKDGVLYVRHGKNPKGADKFALKVVYGYHNAGVLDVIEEPYPADWQHEGCNHPKGTRPPNDGGMHGDADWYCKFAGPIRNQRMLDDLPDGEVVDRLHAFPDPNSTGTWDMITRCNLAGVEVVNHGVQFPPKGWKFVDLNSFD